MKRTEIQQGTKSEAFPSHFAPFTSHFTPFPLRLARILLVAALPAASLAVGAVVSWAWMALALVASLALFLWALGCVQQGAAKLIWSPLFVPLALFFLLALAQYAAHLTLDGSETRRGIVLLAADLVFFFLAVQFFAGPRNRVLCAFGLGVLVFAGSMGLFAILQFLSGARLIYGFIEPLGGPFGPYVDPDHFAGLMEMLLPVAVFSMAGHRRRFTLEGWVWRLFAAILALASLLLSGSRGGLLGLSVETAVAAWVLRRVGSRITERRGSAMAGAIALLAGLLLFTYVDPGRVAQKLGSVANLNRTWAEWVGGRKSMALDGLRMWRAHPLLGVGLGDFETAYPRYQSFPTDLYVDHAHNDYIEAAAETGLVGALLILSALALFVRLAFRNSGQPFRSQEGWIRMGAALGCCGMLVHSLVDFNLHIPANAAWFAVLAGIATTARDATAAQD